MNPVRVVIAARPHIISSVGGLTVLRRRGQRLEALDNSFCVLCNALRRDTRAWGGSKSTRVALDKVHTLFTHVSDLHMRTCARGQYTLYVFVQCFIVCGIPMRGSRCECSCACPLDRSQFSKGVVLSKGAVRDVDVQVQFHKTTDARCAKNCFLWGSFGDVEDGERAKQALARIGRLNTNWWLRRMCAPLYIDLGRARNDGADRV